MLDLVRSSVFKREIKKTELYLYRIGSHSNLFK